MESAGEQGARAKMIRNSCHGVEGAFLMGRMNSKEKFAQSGLVCNVVLCFVLLCRSEDAVNQMAVTPFPLPSGSHSAIEVRFVGCCF